MSNPIIEKINQALLDVEQRLAADINEADIEQVRIDIFGRKGMFPALSKEMKDISPEQRRETGQAFNVAKEKFQALLDAANERLTGSTADDSVCDLDLTLPGRKWNVGRKHPITIMIDDCVAVFRRMGFIVASGPDMETVYPQFRCSEHAAGSPFPRRGGHFLFRRRQTFAFTDFTGTDQGHGKPGTAGKDRRPRTLLPPRYS